MSIPFTGQIILVAFDFAPASWVLCNGQQLSTADYPLLLEILGWNYSTAPDSEGRPALLKAASTPRPTTFALPDLRGRVIVGTGPGPQYTTDIGSAGGSESVTLAAAEYGTHAHTLMGGGAATTGTPGPSVALGLAAGTNVYATTGTPAALASNAVAPTAGEGQPHENRQPFTTLNYVMCMGYAPGEPLPFIGQVSLFPFDVPPTGWALCQGQLLPIAENQELYSLIKTTYGGDGQTTFALPDLRGRVPNGQGAGPGLQTYMMGQTGGAETVTLTSTTSPSHTHTLSGFAAEATTGAPSADALPAQASDPDGVSVNLYAAAGSATTLAPAQLSQAGGGQPHNNLQPFLVLNWCIALQGTVPTPPYQEAAHV